MAYTITSKVYQTSTNAFFRVVEKAVFSNGTWDEVNDTHILTIGGSGTSGCLRFVADTGENFIVTLGVHNYKPWGDIVTKLSNDQTGVKINPEYYEKEYGGTQNADRVAVRWKNLSTYEVTRDGRKYSFTFVVASGNALKVNIVIG